MLNLLLYHTNPELLENHEAIIRTLSPSKKAELTRHKLYDLSSDLFTEFNEHLQGAIDKAIAGDYHDIEYFFEYNEIDDRSTHVHTPHVTKKFKDSLRRLDLSKFSNDLAKTNLIRYTQLKIDSFANNSRIFDDIAEGDHTLLQFFKPEFFEDYDRLIKSVELAFKDNVYRVDFWINAMPSLAKRVDITEYVSYLPDYLTYASKGIRYEKIEPKLIADEDIDLKDYAARLSIPIDTINGFYDNIPRVAKYATDTQVVLATPDVFAERLVDYDLGLAIALCHMRKIRNRAVEIAIAKDEHRDVYSKVYRGEV